MRIFIFSILTFVLYNSQIEKKVNQLSALIDGWGIMELYHPMISDDEIDPDSLFIMIAHGILRDSINYDYSALFGVNNHTSIDKIRKKTIPSIRVRRTSIQSIVSNSINHSLHVQNCNQKFRYDSINNITKVSHVSDGINL